MFIKKSLSKIIYALIIISTLVVTTLSSTSIFATETNSITKNNFVPRTIPSNIITLEKKSLSTALKSSVLTAATSYITPSLTSVSKTSNSITVNAQFPLAGAYGNGLWYYDPIKSSWLLFQNNWSSKNGNITINNLTPGIAYTFYLAWYTDKSNSWLLRTSSYLNVATLYNYNTPSLTSVSKTSNSITVNVRFPKSGINGNGLAYYDPTNASWVLFSNNWYLTDGTYTINNLKPGTTYTFSLIWYTDASNSWLKRTTSNFAITTDVASTQKYASSGTTYHVWPISDFQDGGYAIYWCGAYCSANYFETYSKSDSSTVLTKHEVFAHAENWGGASLGYDPLYVAAGQDISYYNSNGAKIASTTISTKNSNVLVDSSWCWDDRYSTSKITLSASPVTGKISPTFYCNDTYVVYSSPTKSVTCTLNCN